MITKHTPLELVPVAQFNCEKNVQLRETQEHFLFLLKIPGLKKENLNIEICLKQHLIVHSGSQQMQAYTLPSLVKSQGVKASCSKDTLQILLYKDTASPTPHQIH